MKAVAMLKENVKHIAILHGNDSESAHRFVAALISKLRKRLMAGKQEQTQQSRHQPQPQLLNLKNTDFAPQPQPQKADKVMALTVDKVWEEDAMG